MSDQVLAPADQLFAPAPTNQLFAPTTSNQVVDKMRNLYNQVSDVMPNVSYIFTIIMVIRIVLLIVIVLIGIIFSWSYNRSNRTRQDGLRKVWITWVGEAGVVPMAISLSTAILVSMLIGFIIKEVEVNGGDKVKAKLKSITDNFLKK